MAAIRGCGCTVNLRGEAEQRQDCLRGQAPQLGRNAAHGPQGMAAKRFPGPAFFITGKDKGKLGYFWEHVYLKARSGPNLGGVVNPDSGLAILDSEMQKLTALDFTDKLKVSEALTPPRGGTTRFSALWQADRTRIQRMAPIEYIGRYMRGWFDFAIADELHQLAGDTAQSSNAPAFHVDARRND